MVGTCIESELKNVQTGKIYKKRPLGRPRTRRKDTVENDLRLIDENATTMDREKMERLPSGSADFLNGPLIC